MGLLDDLLQRRTAEKRELAAVAVREAAGKSKLPDDLDALDSIVARRDDGEAYAEVLDVVEQCGVLEEKANALADAETAEAQARREIEKYRVETVAIAAKRKTELQQLQREYVERANQARQAMTAAGRLTELKETHRELFGGEAVDLDAYTLITPDTQIAPADPNATLLLVSPRLLQRETARRHGIMNRAHARALKEYQEQVERWRERNTVDGEVIARPDDPAPRSRPATWADAHRWKLVEAA